MAGSPTVSKKKFRKKKKKQTKITNTAMRLSEERAEQLVDEWTRDCGQILMASPGVASRGGSVASQLVLTNDFQFRDVALAAAHGDALRRTMEGLNALACCAGFRVEENPAFWRQQLRKLTAGDSTALQLHSLISSTILTRYCIRLELSERINSTAAACALATCVDMGYGDVRGARIRESVSEMLGDYLCKSPPTLKVEIELVPIAGRPNAYHDCRWLTFGDSLAEINHIWALEGAFVTGPVVVVLGHERNPIWFNAERLQNAVHLVESSGALIHLRELHCELHNFDHGWSGYRALADLMTCLARIDTVESLSLKLEKWNTRLSTIACSALPYMLSLTTLTLFPTLPDIHWIAYALQSRQRRGLSPLSLHVQLLPGTCTQLRAAIAMANCVAVHVPPIIQVRIHPTILPVGTTVAVQQHAELMPKPFLDGDKTLKLSESHRMIDVIAQCGSRHLVVIPGVGLRWVYDYALFGSREDTDVVPPDAPGNPLALETLVCENSRLVHIVDMLALTGRNLASLTLIRCADTISTDALTTLLKHCAQLKCLVLSDVHVASFTPLVEACASGACALSTLVYKQRTGGGTEDERTGGTTNLLAALCDLHHPMAKTLEVLTFVSVPPLLPQIGYQESVKALAKNRRLRFARVSVTEEGDQRDLLMSVLQDQPLLQSETSKAALYAFLWAVDPANHGHDQGMEHPLACHQLIAEFAAMRPRRQVSFG